MGEYYRDAGIRQHERDALLRIARIDGDVRGAGLQDAQNADHHLDRTLDEQADEHLRTRAQHPQVMRQRVGTLVQLGVRQHLLFIDDGVEMRRTRGLLLDQLMETESGGSIRRCPVGAVPASAALGSRISNADCLESAFTRTIR